MKEKTKSIRIAGFHSGHDCSFCVLKDGIPEVHLELERYCRYKEPIDDSLKFLFDKYQGPINEIDFFVTGIDIWNGGPHIRFPKTWQRALDISQKNKGDMLVFGHHHTHAANAFFSSNFNKALVITIDGGGEEKNNNQIVISNFTVWQGNDIELNPIGIFGDDYGDFRVVNFGSLWSNSTEKIFGLSRGFPKGHQAGTIMAMACIGKTTDYYDDFITHLNGGPKVDYEKYRKLIENDETDKIKFDIAAALQLATENKFKELLSRFIQSDTENICLSGGVALNCIMVGKIFDWFPQIKNVYVDPVPYDSGITLGAARIVWHQILKNPRIKWQDNSTSYLGYEYHSDYIKQSIEVFAERLDVKHNVENNEIADLLIDKKLVAVFGGSSESGRRALGNRSILADPRYADTKERVNDKIKHRQWFRPFAPSILADKVSDWFVHDIESPYMSIAIKFKPEKAKEVPAVVHYDNTGRMQTVTVNDNPWYYDLISKFEAKTNVPILLNTSFNDREPIVETPAQAIECFIKTNIDYLYFYKEKILVSNKYTYLLNQTTRFV